MATLSLLNNVTSQIDVTFKDCSLKLLCYDFTINMFPLKVTGLCYFLRRVVRRNVLVQIA